LLAILENNIALKRSSRISRYLDISLRVVTLPDSQV